MKFRYLFLTLIALFPILNVIGDYNYRKTVKEEIINFNIEVLNDNQEIVDTISLKIKLNIPKYYTLKKYTINISDCITCGNQYYTFYKNPTQETISENDTIITGFFSSDKNRNIDSITLNIFTYRNLFITDLNEKCTQNTAIEIFIANAKNDSDSDYKILNIGNDINERNVVLYEDQYGIHIKSFFVSNHIPIRINLSFFKKDNKLKNDFYKLLKSVKIESSHSNPDAVKQIPPKQTNHPSTFDYQHLFTLSLQPIF